MRNIIIGALLIAVVIVLIRTVLGTPAIKRITEAFQNTAPNLLNSDTECPSGYTLYMYNGSSYCCSGQVNTDADDVSRTCRAVGPSGVTATFCTLGPPQHRVPNCLEMRAGRMQAAGANVCPPDAPNYVESKDGARCCAGPGNAALTDCADPNPAGYCNVSSDPNEFKDPKSCQFLRAQSEAGRCPPKYARFTTQGQGSMTGLTLYGCTDMGTNCYPAGAVQRLNELGYDTTGLAVCSS
jgi:hypothetical protein